jgi:sulfur transfer protein SufE
MFEPGCDAGSSIKISGMVETIELTGVGGPTSQVLTIRLSDKHTYSARADASAGVLAGYVALFSSAYSDKRPVTIHYGCEVGIRVIHSVDLP